MCIEELGIHILSEFASHVSHLYMCDIFYFILINDIGFSIRIHLLLGLHVSHNGYYNNVIANTAIHRY